MESQANTPHGQPITPNPTDPRYAPQPLQTQGQPHLPNKRLLLMILSAIGLLALLAGLFWFLSKGAKQDYAQAAATYKKDIANTRDAMNTELNSKKVSASSAQAKPIFEANGKKMQSVVTKAPKAPTVLGFIPAGGDTSQVDTLSNTASAYANALRNDYDIYRYYTEVAEDFKPIKDLGTITFANRDKVIQWGQQWPKFTAYLRTVKPPKTLQAMHADLVKQATTLDTKIQALVKNFDKSSDVDNDRTLGELQPLTVKFNKTFTEGVQNAANQSYEAVNNTYDKLDTQLK